MSIRLVAASATLAMAAWAGQLELAKQVRPVYPPEAKQAGITGKVKMEIHVTAQGKVADVRALSGHPLLIAATEEAVRQWEYKPMASSAAGEIELNFALPAKTEEKVVSGSEQQMRLTHKVAPAYPPDAKIKGISGLVALEASIDKEGKVTRVRVLEGNPLLVEPAVEAVRQWRYDPMAVDGKPVDVVTRVDVNFKLAE